MEMPSELVQGEVTPTTLPKVQPMILVALQKNRWLITFVPFIVTVLVSGAIVANGLTPSPRVMTATMLLTLK